MKAGWKISNRIAPHNEFFYLFNWNNSNEIDLAGYWKNEDKHHKTYKNCLGVWKIKKLK